MPEDGQREGRIARTLCAGIRFETTSGFVRPSRWQDVKGFAPIWEAFQAYAQGLSQGGSRPQITAGDLQPDELEKCFKAFRIAAGLACRGRRLFITEDRHIGLGPGRMEEGDVVSVIYGAHWPFVLRPVGKQFQLVGYCYVDGIMGGEMIDCADTSVQDLCIV
ncbi:het domain-containing protein [Neofusicoccum parvum]|nr:het domain-containing protein [Neofusicoccum parvum]